MKQRIVLDTNCLIASLSKKGEWYIVWQSILNGKVVLCVSNEIINEYREIIERITNITIAENVVTVLLNLPNVHFVNPTFRFNLIEADPDDNKFVDCAIVANAKFIVSNDRHFDELKKIHFPKVTVISLLEFKKSLIR